MIVFRNPGLLDVRALTTFGLSSKASQDDKIGRFGTGLKYATAVIVRNGGSMQIVTDGESFTTGTRQEAFRGEEITQVLLNDIELPFTTDLGRDWEIWMAFRELYSNCLDEGGALERHEDLPEFSCDETLICVTLDAFEAIYFSMEEHFIGADEEPLYTADRFEVYAGRSSFVFNRGIAVQKLKQPAKFRYNLLNRIDLTEDRTAKYNFQVENAIASGLMACTDPRITAEAVDQRNDFEAKIDFTDVTTKPSKVFLGSAVAAASNCNPTATAIVRSQLPKDASKATIVAKGAPGAEALSNALQTLRNTGADLSKAKFVLAEGVPIYRDFDVRGDAVYLSEAIFNNQHRMTLAVIEGYARVLGGSWMAKRLIALTDEETQF